MTMKKIRTRAKAIGRWIAVLLLFVLMSCATVQFRQPMVIEAFEIVSVERFDHPVSKALFDTRTQTTYVMHRDWHEIHLYRDGKRINRIGGLGVVRGNFQKLSDIALDNDGGLLALDSAARQIRKFNSDGMFITQIDLAGMMQPKLMAVGSDQSIYIYDGLNAEIIVLSLLDGKEQYRFGKFELERISQLSCSRDYVLAYSATLDKTLIFTILGQNIRVIDALCIYDSFNNLIEYRNGVLTGSSGAIPIAVPAGVESSLSITDDTLVYSADHEVRRILISYRSGL